MLFFPTEVRDSEIAGKGLFALEAIPRGAIIGILSHQIRIMTEQEYQDAQEAGHELITQTGIRWVGQYFLFCSSLSNEDFINHSTEPNMIYHCGILFARSNVAPEEELTADYKYFLAENDFGSFKERDTNAMVSGAPAREALIQSAREIIELYQTVDLDEPRYSEYQAFLKGR
jgi:SET domain-containing protein